MQYGWQWLSLIRLSKCRSLVNNRICHLFFNETHITSRCWHLAHKSLVWDTDSRIHSKEWFGALTGFTGVCWKEVGAVTVRIRTHYPSWYMPKDFIQSAFFDDRVEDRRNMFMIGNLQEASSEVREKRDIQRFWAAVTVVRYCLSCYSWSKGSPQNLIAHEVLKNSLWVLRRVNDSSEHAITKQFVGVKRDKNEL